MAAEAQSVASPLVRTPRPRAGTLVRLLRDRVSAGGLVLVLFFGLAACIGSWAAPHNPNAVDPATRLAQPSRLHPLGTDHLGRDELSRLLYGARASLGAAMVAALGTLLIGVVVGAVAGFYGGLLDHGLMRVVDVLLAFPTLVLALAITGTLGPGLRNLVLSVIVIGWAGYARVVRGVALAIGTEPYIEAARAAGASDGRMILRHLIPNLVGPIVVLWTLDLGRLLLTLAGLSFLGLGIRPPAPEWGAMLNQGRPFLERAPQLMIYPGLTITLVVLGFNLFGDGLRDALDPRFGGSKR